MKIIGEKINGTIQRVAKAIQERDADFIKDLAVRQAAAGSHWLDVNAGTSPDRECDDLIWLVEIIQGVVDIPLCLDSANPKAIAAALRAVARTPMINSISGDPERLEKVLPLVTACDGEVIALAMDAKKIPETWEKRLEVVDKVMDATRSARIPDHRVYIDPLAMTVATHNQSALIACDTIRAVKSRYPNLHFTLGLSNISFGLPARKQINRAFLVLALQAGLDSAILDPLDQQLRATILTAELLLGQDKYCKNYLLASRHGMFEKTKKRMDG